MSVLLKLLQSLIPHVQTESDLDEAYLAKSADAYDFERRLREIDNRNR
jgi:hypothetical protein